MFNQNSNPISSSHWLALFEQYQKAAEMSSKPQSELFGYLNQINFGLHSASRIPIIMYDLIFFALRKNKRTFKAKQKLNNLIIFFTYMYNYDGPNASNGTSLIDEIY